MPTKKPCARGLGSGLGGKTAAKCKMAKPKVAAKAELGDDDTLAVSVGADVEGEVDEFKEGSITELDGEGEAKEARKVKKKRLYRRKLCCCTLQQKRMHRNVKFAQFFMFCSLGCSIFAAFRPDWTVLSTRRENFQFPVDPDAVPCHGRPTCARCLDGTTEPKLPLPNPDVVSIPGGSPVTDPEQDTHAYVCLCLASVGVCHCSLDGLIRVRLYCWLRSHGQRQHQAGCVAIALNDCHRLCHDIQFALLLFAVADADNVGWLGGEVEGDVGDTYLH